jgi:hypothetical protein
MGQRAEDRGFSFKAMRIRDQAGKSFFTTDITGGGFVRFKKNGFLYRVPDFHNILIVKPCAFGV